jgi:hypothetical protein
LKISTLINIEIQHQHIDKFVDIITNAEIGSFYIDHEFKYLNQQKHIQIQLFEIEDTAVQDKTEPSRFCSG